MVEICNTLIEGIFFVHERNTINEDWCPLCRVRTLFSVPVNVEMDHVEKRKMICEHEITYVFLIEQVNGELVKVVRKRIR